MAKRKGFDQAWFSFIQKAEQNKESVITASILIYAVFYLLVGIGGISFQVQPATGYVQTASNSNCPAGAAWIEGDELHWCDGSTEYYALDESGDRITNAGSVSGPAGAVWIEGSNFHWISEGGNELYYQGVDTGNNPSAPNGAAWIEGGYIHYIDQNGNERTISD